METLSALLAICAGNSPVPGEFPTQRPVTRSFDVYFDLQINGWVNNREAGDLRPNRAHYGVIVMGKSPSKYAMICQNSPESTQCWQDRAGFGSFLVKDGMLIQESF